MTYNIQSTAKMSDISSGGNPTVSNTITNVTRPACGIPAAPMLAAVDVILDQTNDSTIDDVRMLSLLYWLILPHSDHFAKGQWNAAELGNKNRCDCFIQSRPIHINCGSNRHHKSCHVGIDIIFFF